LFLICKLVKEIMKRLLQNIPKRHCKLLFLAMLFYSFGFSQIANYVTNGGFENKINCAYPPVLNRAIGWNCIGSDTTKFGGHLYAVNCYSNAPNMGYGIQYPRSGDTYYRLQVFCTSPCTYTYSRFYPKNRLKSNLVANKPYCVKMYVSRQESSPTAISDLGFYFSNNSVDTINYANTPLIYLNPQVKNPNNNIITDTSNWVLVSGAFVANGNEKYLVLGNFSTDAATTSSMVVPGSYTFTEYFVDDVSCIPIDLPAFAGHDNSFIPGTSIYLGRQRDVGIDEACMWYKLPIVITPTTPAIDTAAGIWVNPITTSTYVVRQEICGNVKWDTAVVYQTALGIAPLSLGEGLGVRLYPNPANEKLNITSTIDNGVYEITIYNAFGQVLREEEITFQSSPPRGRAERGLASIKTDDLENGVYVLKLSNKTQTLSKRFIINR
jgi:hypothetical protein